MSQGAASRKITDDQASAIDPKGTPRVSAIEPSISPRLATDYYSAALAVLPACGSVTLNSTNCSALADLAQERQPACVGVDVVEQVFRHDLGEAGVAVLDRLVELPNALSASPRKA